MNGRRKTLKYFILTILAVAFLSGCDRRENAKARIYSITIMTCSVSTLSLALTLISFTVPPAGA